MSYAPIIVFAYKRVDHLKKTLEAIKSNTIAAESDLIVFSDGPKNNCTRQDIEDIENVRRLIVSRQWCKNTKLIAHETNKGLNDNFFDSVAEVLNQYGKAIIIEDDIVVSPYFLEFMNAGLNTYESENNVFQISGYVFDMKTRHLPSSYFMSIPLTWGWGTWKNRWSKLIKDPKEILKIAVETNAYNNITLEGSQPDFWNQLQANADGKANDWDNKWFCTVILNNGLTLYPNYSLVNNIGFDGSGSHFHNGDMGFKSKTGEGKISLHKQDITENNDAKKALIQFFRKTRSGFMIRFKEKMFLLFNGKHPR